MGLPNLNTSNTIQCPDVLINSIKSFVFSGMPSTPEMEIVQGANILTNLDLSQLYIPLNNYSLQNYTLEASGSITLTSNGIGTAGSVQFIALLLTYPAQDLGNVTIDTADKYVHYQYPEGGQTFNVGQIMILSGTQTNGWVLTNSPGGLLLINPHDNFDVDVRVLMFQ